LAVLAYLLPDQVTTARLSAALRDQFLTVACDSWAQLFRTAERRPVSVAVVDPQTASGDEANSDALRRLRRTYTSLAIVAYVSSPPVTEFDLFEYGRLGLDALVVKDRSDSPRVLRATVERAEARGLLDPIRRALVNDNPTVRDAILMAVSRAQQRLSPESMARTMGITRAHLAAQLSAGRYPSPQQLIAWGRLVVAGRMLEDERRSANAVAAALEFPSGSAFRNACQRYLCATPAEIRVRGGAAYAVALFFKASGRSAPALEASCDAVTLSVA